MKNTPTPWALECAPNSRDLVIYYQPDESRPKSGRRICTLAKKFTPEDIENGRLICRSVNAHEMLMNALRACQVELASAFNPGGENDIIPLGRSTCQHLSNLAQGVLAVAEGKE